MTFSFLHSPFQAFVPEVKSQKLRIRLFNHLQSTVSPGIFDKPSVYDGKHIIYSCGKLTLANKDNETVNPHFFASLPSP